MKALQRPHPNHSGPLTPQPSKPAAGEALIRTSRMGICGTGVSCYLGKFPFRYPASPATTGRGSARGGEGVSNVRPGIVARSNLLIAGMQLLKGRETAAKTSRSSGHDGWRAVRAFDHRADKLHPSDKLIRTTRLGRDPSMVAMHPIGDENRRTCLVIGAGPIGRPRSNSTA